MESNLNRFIIAQAPMYTRALEEIQQSRKQSHWMWFIFSKNYAIRNLAEARDYLHHERYNWLSEMQFTVPTGFKIMRMYL